MEVVSGLGRALAPSDLNSQQVEIVAQKLPGNVENIQDILPLTPTQECVLNTCTGEGGNNLHTSIVFLLLDQTLVDNFLTAITKVVERHDALRTAIIWEGLEKPLQVVHRSVSVPVERVEEGPGADWQAQIDAPMDFQSKPIDLHSAPLMKLRLVEDTMRGRWRASLQIHYLVCDRASFNTIVAEILAFMQGRGNDLPVPVPYRNQVAIMSSDSGVGAAKDLLHQKFSDVDESSAPFGIASLRGGKSHRATARLLLEPAIMSRMQVQADWYGVHVDRILHAAWGLVVARTTGSDWITFGSVRRVQRCALASGSVGLFTNVLPVRLHLQGISAHALLEQVNQELETLLNFENISFAVAKRCSGMETGSQLFSTLMNCHTEGPSAEQGVQVPGVEILLGREAEMCYPITVSIDELGTDTWLLVRTDARLDPDRIVGYLQRAIHSLVGELEVVSTRHVLDLPVLGEDEIEAIERMRAGPKVKLSGPWLIHELFEEQVRRKPDALAVVHGEKSLTYAEVNARANRLAGWLRSLGVGPDRLVGLCMKRSLDMVTALLGILKAGAAYVPLDPYYPPDRLRYMVEDSAPVAVLTQSDLLHLLPSSGPVVRTIDWNASDIQNSDSADTSAAEIDLTADHLAYVIYTSGSTGLPKGIAMPHRPVANLLKWHASTLGCSGQRVLQFAALSFDVSFQETFSTLCDGGTLILIDEELRKDVGGLLDFITQYSVQRFFIPCVVLRVLAEYSRIMGITPSTLQDVIAAGEQLHVTPDVEKFFDKLGTCRLHNHYGPAETHVVTYLTLVPQQDRWPSFPSIGRPIWNTQVHILDRGLRPAPIGAIGEIFIGGICVSRGYLGRDELTQQRYLQDPFCDDTSARLYRTGDLARYAADGQIEYMGRTDHQIKVHGVRVEPGEIEARLVQCESVKDAAVIAQTDSEGMNRLVAYVTSTGADLDATELRSRLREILPSHMIPSALVVLKELPLSPNGKLDRRALPLPGHDDLLNRSSTRSGNRQGHVGVNTDMR